MHGAFAGFTGFTVGLVNTHYVYLPIPVIIQVRSPPSPSLEDDPWCCSRLARKINSLRPLISAYKRVNKCISQQKLPVQTQHVGGLQAARTVDPKGRNWNRLKTAINLPDLV